MSSLPRISQVQLGHLMAILDIEAVLTKTTLFRLSTLAQLTDCLHLQSQWSGHDCDISAHDTIVLQIS